MIERLVARARGLEDGLTGLALVLMAVLPVLELGLRVSTGEGIPGSQGYVQHLTLWVGFLGAMVAAREKRHLTLWSGAESLPARVRGAASVLAAAAASAVSTGLAFASFDFVKSEMESPNSIAGWLPVWVAEIILPVSFAVLAIRFPWAAGGWRARAAAALGIPVAAATLIWLPPYGSILLWPGLLILLVAVVLGAPIFVALGGAALLLFFREGVPLAAIPVEAYRIVVSPWLPTIPLFTLTGYVLAEGGASGRLVRLFRALFGWMPGGLAIVATLVCAFFTTFTGASGVTILALGGLLLPVLLGSGYREKFSVGLLTATGSLGLLFPPSLPVILYGVVAHVPIPDLFKAGAIPGALLVLAVCVMGIVEGYRSGAERPAFHVREALAALSESKWEVALPVVALLGIFGGFCTLIEAAAITAVYALFVESLVYRDVRLARDLPKVLVKCVVLLGGVFTILGVAMGLTNYLVDAEVPMHAADWVQAHITSRLVFLLALNVFLLIVGCLMDIFSALVVVVPLILPISEVFQIHPLHLGIIFLANLQLGYLTPPVGMNLFLASYRFEKPVVQVYRDAVPFLIVLLAVVLLITYAPWLTTWVGP